MEYADLDSDARLSVWEALNDRRYYLLLGAGVSLDSEGSGQKLLGAGVLRDNLCDIVGIPKGKTLQQAYSLLDKDQIDLEITQKYKVDIPGRTISDISVIPWRRIYTLNVDNAVEVFSSNQIKDRGGDVDRFYCHNFVDSYHDPVPDAVNSIVHLHGTVDRPASGYVFSHQEYAKQMVRVNPWMATLSQLIKSEPFIVAGTTLDEIDVTYYLEQRNYDDIPDKHAYPSVLVEPYPDKLTEKLCSDHNLYLFRGTAIAFFEQLRDEFGDFSDPFSLPQPRDAFLAAVPEAVRLRFEESFERVRPQGDVEKKSAKFLLGAELTWPLLRGNADIFRDVMPPIEREIENQIKNGVHFLVIFDDPASGKTSMLRRLAMSLSKSYSNVFYFKGREFVSDEDAAGIFSNLSGDLLIFSDNLADSVSYLEGVAHYLDGRRFVIVSTERIYRRRYVEDALSEWDVAIIGSQLDLTIDDARRLVRRHGEVGLADFDVSDKALALRKARSVLGDQISIAACRIQNNFFNFDKIVEALVGECDEDLLKLYLVVSLSRYCYSGGVSRSILGSIPGVSLSGKIGNLGLPLPIKYDQNSGGYVVPARAAVSERVIGVIKKRNPNLLLESMVDLANALSHRVNRAQIRARSPEAKLAGGLMDFDRAVQRFINDDAEKFYEDILDGWTWNSRYWEQLSLLKLDRYLANEDDQALLQESIQNARYAFSIERHPLSLTTLAKALFAALDARMGDRDSVFNEGWQMISQSIDIEKNWARVRSTAFIVCFRGVASFINSGGLLTGEQASELRDIIAITYAKKLKDRKMSQLRDDISSLIT